MGWPRRFSLKAGKKRHWNFWFFQVKLMRKITHFLYVRRKYVLLVSWFVRFHIFALKLLIQILAFIFYLNYWIFCSCDHPDANFTTVSFFHLLILLCWNQNKIYMSIRLLQYCFYITLLFFLKWFWEVFKTFFFVANTFLFIFPVILLCLVFKAIFHPYFLPLLNYFT